MKAYIKAISYFLPEKTVTNEDLVKEFPEWSIEKVSSKVGVEVRHIAGEKETAGDLAERAASNLFKEYGISPLDIDFILFCTQSPDYHLPSTSCILQSKLGIPTTAGAFDYNLGCSGCIYGLAMAKSLIVSGMARNVLLLTGETYNKYIQTSDKSNRSIFGDGAAACLVSTEGVAEICDFVLGTDGNGAEKLIVRTGGARNRLPKNDTHIDEEGHEVSSDYLYMDGPAIFNFTLDVVPGLVSEILVKNKLSKDNIDFFVFHQANKFMLGAIRKVCHIEKEKFYINLSNVGNTVSSTVLIGLADSLKNGSLKKGMSVMVAGFGVGLSWGGTVLKF